MLNIKLFGKDAGPKQNMYQVISIHKHGLYTQAASISSYVDEITREKIEFRSAMT